MVSERERTKSKWVFETLKLVRMESVGWTAEDVKNVERFKIKALQFCIRRIQ